MTPNKRSVADTEEVSNRYENGQQQQILTKEAKHHTDHLLQLWCMELGAVDIGIEWSKELEGYNIDMQTHFGKKFIELVNLISRKKLSTEVYCT